MAHKATTIAAIGKPMAIFSTAIRGNRTLLTAITDSKLTITAILFAVGLVFLGQLRLFAVNEDLDTLSAIITLLFVAWTVLAISRMSSAGMNFRSFGIRVSSSPGRVILLCVAAVVAIKFQQYFLEQFFINRAGIARDMSRFDSSVGTLPELFLTIGFSWVFAAAGEEIAFRIVLFKSLAQGLGGSPNAIVLALVLQALVFGLVHAYQGPVAIVSTALSGLIYGILVLLSRGSILPSFFAHGIGNSISLFLLYSNAIPE